MYPRGGLITLTSTLTSDMPDQPFDFAAVEGGGLVSPFGQAMKAYAGTLYHTDHDLPHPLVMHARAMRDFDTAAFDLATKTTNLAFEAGVNPDLGMDNSLMRLWQETVYRATELFDTLHSHIPTALGVKADRSIRRRLEPLVASTKARRDPWATLCNRLKHNHHVLVPHRCRYASGRTVDGYRVSKHDAEGALVGSQEFHKHIRAIGVATALRELIHDIVRTDQTAAKMVGTGVGDGTVILKRALGAMQAMPMWPNIYEHGQRSVLATVPGGFRLARYILEPIREDSVQSSMTTADGFTRTFEVP